MSSELQLDVRHLNRWRRHLVNAYEVKAGMVFTAGKRPVWSMPERFRVVCIPCKALYKCSDFFSRTGRPTEIVSKHGLISKYTVSYTTVLNNKEIRTPNSRTMTFFLSYFCNERLFFKHHLQFMSYDQIFNNTEQFQHSKLHIPCCRKWKQISGAISSHITVIKTKIHNYCPQCLTL